MKNKKGELIAQPLPQPTLPNLSVDDDDDSSINTRVAPSTYTKDSYQYQVEDYPPMPAYNPYSTHQAPGSYAHFNPSTTTFAHEDSNYQHSHMYDEEHESTARLTASAAPFAQTSIERPAPNSFLPSRNIGNNYDVHDVYYGRAGPAAQSAASRRSPPTSISGGLAYDDDDSPDYTSQQYSQSAYLASRPAQPSNDPYGGYPGKPNTPGYDEESGRYGAGYSRAV